MLEITLAEPDDFLKVCETLTRIGVASRKENKLFQSCHILHKQGRYYIVHFKELFMLDGKKSNLEEYEKELVAVDIPPKVFIKQPIFENLKEIFGKDVEILVTY